LPFYNTDVPVSLAGRNDNRCNTDVSRSIRFRLRWHRHVLLFSFLSSPALTVVNNLVASRKLALHGDMSHLPEEQTNPSQFSSTQLKWRSMFPANGIRRHRRRTASWMTKRIDQTLIATGRAARSAESIDRQTDSPMLYISPLKP